MTIKMILSGGGAAVQAMLQGVISAKTAGTVRHCGQKPDASTKD
ncbi:MAG: hypothetical protein ACOY4H_00570 [Thermodesulfobacteriota bacterium]